MSFTKPTIDQLAQRFDFHPARGDQGERYEEVRHAIKQAAITCVSLTPCSPEQTRALNALDEAMMLFNAAIARHESPAGTPTPAQYATSPAEATRGASAKADAAAASVDAQEAIRDA